MNHVMNRRSVLPVLALAGLFATFATAADKPDFSGSWKMNPSKSDFGPMPAPDKLERNIKHADPTLSMSSVTVGAQGEMKTEETYTTDGKESVNKIGGAEIKSVAAWDGDKLVIKSKREVQGMEISIVQNWSLSGGGKVLTVVTNASTPQGDFVLTAVLEKQDGGSATAAAPAAAAVTTASAGPKPDFSGDWKLNVDKSNFGPMPPPTSQTRSITHKDPAIKMVTKQSGAEGDVTLDLSYATDGTESKNDFMGNTMKSTAKWEGDALIINSKLDFQGTEVVVKETWKLSTDGKTLSTASKISTPQGDFDTASVLEKVTK